MKLYMKKKIFSWHERFFIKNEAGDDCYSVMGELLTLAKKLHISDMGGTEVAFIHQKLLAMEPKFFVEMDGKEVCEIVREFRPFHPGYQMKGTSWRIDGNFLEHEYTVSDNGRTVMTLSKKWFSWGDSYELDIADPKDAILCLCAALAVECVIEEERSVNTAGESHDRHPPQQ